MQDTVNKIVDWAHARNLVNGCTSKDQMSKLVEELGELATGINKKKIDLIKDGIGDAVVVLTILAAQNGLTLAGCVDTAYNEIKDRTGRMIDGVFVKDADL